MQVMFKLESSSRTTCRGFEALTISTYTRADTTKEPAPVKGQGLDLILRGSLSSERPQSELKRAKDKLINP